MENSYDHYQVERSNAKTNFLLRNASACFNSCVKDVDDFKLNENERKCVSNCLSTIQAVQKSSK